MWSTGRSARKRFMIFAAVLITIPFMISLLQPERDTSTEMGVIHGLASLKDRLSAAEMINNARRYDVALLARQYARSTFSHNTNSATVDVVTNAPLDEIMQMDVQRLISHPNHGQDLRIPTIFSFFPHLLKDPASLVPAVVVGQGKPFVPVVLGIPTVKREAQSYLLPTLDSLLSSMSDAEKNETLIVVFIAETDQEYVSNLVDKIKKQFPDALSTGLMEIIAPPASYYPDLDQVPLSMGDPKERVRWRTKQNLDYAFLMMYAQSRSVYYVQLEDDILTTKGYITSMREFALSKAAKQEDWFLLDFCQLGFIGKMFHNIDLPYIVMYAIMFHKDKPVDWLIDPLIQVRYCPHDAKKCAQIRSAKWVHYKPSLFQHVGTTSSLKGKVQKLKDKQFGKLPVFTPHSNPPAHITCPIKAYKQHTIERAYKGESFFWGLMPQAGDLVLIELDTPAVLKGFKIRSGNYEHPSDLLYNTTVEILPVSPPSAVKDGPLPDGFFVVGHFNDLGVAEEKLDPYWGPLQSLRLHIQSESKNWVILSEIALEVDQS